MNWPRFLLVESGDDSLPVNKLSPFAIDKGFQALISGRLRSIERLRNGTFLVECDTKKQSDLLLKSQKLVDRPMKVSIHPTVNSSCGVIRCRELVDMSETDIRDELSEQGVILVKRIRRREEGQEKETNTLFLTFCNASLPKDILIGYLRVKVDPFIPNPLCCFKCQNCGHGAQRCSSAAVCPKCALEHEGPCTNPPQVRELWRGTSIVIKGLQHVEKGKTDTKGENWEENILPWCLENSTGDQLLVAAWRKTSFCLKC